MSENAWNKRLINLSKLIGEDLALYCICAVQNIPYSPDIEYEDFSDYKSESTTIGRKFEDGIIDVRQAIKRTETDIDHWKNVWGIGDENKPYTVDDYKRLDDLFATYSSRLQRAGGMDALQDDTLRVCSKMRLEADKALAKGGKDNISIASTLNKMIQDNLSSEQLRKKDAKPVDTARIDGIVEALAKKYGVGMKMTTDDAIRVCSEWLMSHHYPVTMDAAEHMIQSIINCTRDNNDLPALDDIPDYAKFDAGFAHEFETSPNELEEEAYRYLGYDREEDRPKPDETE